MKDLKPYIEAYISNWRYINGYEDYKWYAIKHFQDTYFVNDLPFGTRIKQSFSKHVNLLDTRRYFPLGVLADVYSSKPKLTEEMITALFDETKPLKDRVVTYMEEFGNTMNQMAEEGFSDWYGRTNLQSFQDAHAISVYLSMRYPRHYYIYKYGIFRDFSNIVGYEIQHSDKVDRYIEFNQLCDVVKKSLLAEIPFISFYDSWLKAHEFDDGNYNLLTQDFIYAVAKYLNHGAYVKTDKKSPSRLTLFRLKHMSFRPLKPRFPRSLKELRTLTMKRKIGCFVDWDCLVSNGQSSMNKSV